MTWQILSFLLIKAVSRKQDTITTKTAKMLGQNS